MFSEMIQNLLNSGGKQAAMQRTTQINKYVNSMNRQLNPNQSVNNSPLDTIYPPGANNVQSFEKVLSSTTQANFGSLLLNPQSMNVNGNIYSGTDDIDTSNLMNNRVLMNAINEVNEARRDYSKTSSNITNKTQLLGMINQVAQRHGVDENLYKPLLSKNLGLILTQHLKQELWA